LISGVIFNAPLGKADEQLRKRGFIWAPSGWRLAPAYDFESKSDQMCSRAQI
jgi:hypothetical protein